MKFRPRDYKLEDESHSIPRISAQQNPLSTLSTTSLQVVAVDHERIEFFDPLRSSDVKEAIPLNELEDEENYSTASTLSAVQYTGQEWSSFKKLLMQRFPVSKMVSLSATSSATIKSVKVNEKLSQNTHLEELDGPKKYGEDGMKVISRQDYISRLHELKDEIKRAWHSEDRVTSLKLSIKVARLLMDTLASEFYPTLFVLATDVMDMLGDLVWERVRLKAEFDENGKSVCSLQDNFEASEICMDAKETCYNWFCKISSIRELLPRIYLELAILPCWRFLVDRPFDSIRRLVMMTRGISDPLASAYCRLYIVHRAHKLPQCELGPILTSINELHVVLMRATHEKLLLSLIEPTIEYHMKMIFKFSYQTPVENIIMGMELGKNLSNLFGKVQYVSIVLHHLLKELPSDVVCSNGVNILHLVEFNNDYSFDQWMNYEILGFRLSEGICQVNDIGSIVDKVLQIISQFSSFDVYLRVLDAYVDIILQSKMGSHLSITMDNIFERASKEGISETEQTLLQSIFVKLITHINDLEDIFAQNHFNDILDMIDGSSRNSVNVHILTKGTKKGSISNPTIIHLLFEVAQSLHDKVDSSNIRNDNNQKAARLISRFVGLVDHGSELERHLSFLIECRGAFHTMNELKETLVHSCNNLAVRAMKERKMCRNFIKSCIAFSEVTVPSVPHHTIQLSLCLGTAEVALFAGLISHFDGLIESAISCMQNVELKDGSRMPEDVDKFLCLMKKLCSLIVMAPGNPKQGVTHIQSCILSFLESRSWITPKIKVKVLCAVISSSAALSQKELPYRAKSDEVTGNDLLFFGHPTYLQELESICDEILRKMVSIILEEPLKAVRGNMALEACNCIASSYEMSDEVAGICSKMLETAKSCLRINDKYLQTTINFLHKVSP